MSLFEGRGVLPSETAKQSPFLLFDLLERLGDEQDEDELPAELGRHGRLFYGL